MRILRLIYLWVCITLSCTPVLAATFVVNNTADTGPGTLRDAIERANANGTTVTDFITFDLPTRRGPITLVFNPNKPLPPLTSNIIVDGNTQPGNFMGVTNAKVGILLEGFWTDNTLYYCAFQIFDATNVQIYGLSLTATVVDRNTGAFPDNLYGIHIRNSSNIIIGSPGKGNHISGWKKGVYAEFFKNQRSNHITIQSNIMGVAIDGISPILVPPSRPGAPTIYATNTTGLGFDQSTDLFIGGENSGEGNSLSSGVDIFCTGSTIVNNNDTISIINNKLGIDVRGTDVDANTAIGIAIQAYAKVSAIDRATAALVIRKNIIGGSSRGIGISLADVKGFFAIEQNQVLGKRARNGATILTGINLGGCDMGIIGDTKTGNENIITWCSQFAIHHTGTTNITMRYNSTSCNSPRAIGIDGWATLNGARPKPFVTINELNQATGTISGTALPNATIDLYEDDNCPDCEGKTHLGIVVITNATGKWTTTNTALIGKSIVATATDNFGATSEYSTPLIDQATLTIKPATCNGTGSICGMKIISGSDWEWRDKDGNVLGKDTCLLNVPAGTYTLWLPIGTGSCTKEYTFTIPDQSLRLDSASGVQKTNTRCNKNNGSICGITPVGATSWAWQNTAGVVVSTNPCLTNIAAGTYRFMVTDGSCTVFSPFYTLTNTTPQIDATNIQITPTTCNKSNGSITGVQLAGMNFSTQQWIDDNRNNIAVTNDLLNVPAGRYKFIVLDNTGGCGDSTAFITVAATLAPALQTSTALVTNATCSQANGSITNITTSNTVGVVAIIWVDETNTIISRTLNLQNLKAGKYRLKLKDESGCDTVFSQEYTIVNNGDVQLDSSQLKTNPAGCTKNNGSITGLKINGATAWEWRNTATNAVIDNTTDVFNLPTGNYQLWAVNNIFNCTVRSSVYTIKQAPPMPQSVSQADARDATCNQNNGTIAVNKLSNNPNYFTYHWLKDSATTVGTSLTLSGLNPATYYMIATDTNGCQQMIYKKVIIMQPMPVLDESNVITQPDECSLGTGSIKGIKATGAAGNITYQWYNKNDIPVGSSANISGLQENNYYLIITDINGCKDTSATYPIKQVISTLPAPLYEHITIPRNTDGTLQVKNKVAGATYQLYDEGHNLLEENATGIFTVKKIPQDRYYYIMYTAGPCVSEQTQVAVKVIDYTKLEIPNVFTPNNDGINDQFLIRVTGYFKLNGLRIFNRWGQLVYETKDLNMMWSGKYNGQNATVGTYYWVIEGIDLFGKMLRQHGSVTLIR